MPRAKGKTGPKNPVIIGEDGLPEPQIERNMDDHFKKTFFCFCPICQYNDGKLQLTKKGTYFFQCKECKIVLYLNDSISISLFRGIQNLFLDEPEVREHLMEAIIHKIPPDTEN